MKIPVPSRSGDLDDLAFGTGKARDAWVQKWTRPDKQVRWQVCLAPAGQFPGGVAAAVAAPRSVNRE